MLTLLETENLCGLQVDDDDIDIYMKEKKDEEEELREAMAAGKESTVFARVKVPTQVGNRTFIMITFLIFYPASRT